MLDLLVSAVVLLVSIVSVTVLVCCATGVGALLSLDSSISESRSTIPTSPRGATVSDVEDDETSTSVEIPFYVQQLAVAAIGAVVMHAVWSRSGVIATIITGSLVLRISSSGHGGKRSFP